MSWLCRLGLHNWIRGPSKPVYLVGGGYLRRCTRCGKVQGVVSGFPKIIDSDPPSWEEFYKEAA